jgi:phosphatidylinositol-3-phosphatase
LRGVIARVLLAILVAGCGSSTPPPSGPTPSGGGLPSDASSPSAAAPIGLASTSPVESMSASPSPSAARTAAPTSGPTPRPKPIPTPKPTPKPAPKPTPPPSGLPSTGANSYEHIFVVVFENHGYGSIVGSGAAPTFNRLIRTGALATNYHAVAHPSLPNYLAMVGGSTFGITSDCSPSTCPVHASNLGSLLSSHGRTWRAYMESMPARCGTTSSGGYAAKHDPFVYFDSVRTTSLCRNVVPYGQLALDLRSNSTTPRLAFVTPNLCHDMHDCSIATGDAWLGGFSKIVMGSAAWTAHRSLLIVTFDEDDGSSSNHVLTFAIGSPIRRSVAAGGRSAIGYSHYSLLRTIEYYLGVATLGRKDAGSSVMTGLIPR